MTGFVAWTVYENWQSPRIPGLRTSGSQDPVFELRYKAMPKQPSLGYDRLFAILARGGL
jgi:hypothetical protein